ncbi:ATP-binding protein [Actinomadura oligospora]|uniref:ATP-binding protein n=1 Tax=Actinomadura oligospora TaxID=111804 RepID=UPI000684BFF6|nr:ATP-binding protein [Actinomadura oligospora]
MAWEVVVGPKRLAPQREGVLDVREVRAQVREWVEPLGVADVDDLELVTTEIVTNAVRHTASGRPGGGVEVSVRLLAGRAEASASRVRVEILDDGGASGVPRFPVDTDPLESWEESGRGLAIVAGLACRAGACRVSDARAVQRWSVWFEMAVDLREARR